MQTASNFSRINFNIPGVKTIGMELIRLVNAKEPDMLQIANTAELDPALFGSIISCANTALYGGISPIVDIRTAVTRLGLKEIKRIIFHVVLESAFRSDNPAIHQLLRDTWQQNLAVSLCMQHVILSCEKLKTLPVEMVAAVYPLGLMHGIGLPVLIANFFQSFARFLQTERALHLPGICERQQQLFGGLDHTILGAELLKRWGFPDFFSTIVRNVHNSDPELSSEVRPLHSLLRYARGIVEDLGYSAHAMTPKDYWQEGNMIDFSAVDNIALSQNVAEQMQQLAALIN